MEEHGEKRKEDPVQDPIGEPEAKKLRLDDGLAESLEKGEEAELKHKMKKSKKMRLLAKYDNVDDDVAELRKEPDVGDVSDESADDEFDGNDNEDEDELEDYEDEDEGEDGESAEDVEEDLSEELSEPEVEPGSKRRRQPVDYTKVLEEMEKEEKDKK